jgi:glycosyltransferase involved in cell wall biosynthesis
MNTANPLVSVGIPIYNGEKFLEATLESILSQTYSNLEIVIFDNASSDGTRKICEAYALEDNRIQYHRNEKNLGAARNYNLTVEHATGKYFKWATHDDLCMPPFIERCVEVLEREPNVSLAYPKTIIIDEHDGIIDDLFEDRFNFREPTPHLRYKSFTRTPLDCNAVFGVMRMSELKKTPCIGAYESSDRVLLGELALLGEIAEVPERLFLRRCHPHISTNACKTKKAMAMWFNPNSSGRFTRLRRFIEYIKSITRVPLSLYQRAYCLFYLVMFYLKFYLGPTRWAGLLKNLRARLASFCQVSIAMFAELKKKEVY